MTEKNGKIYYAGTFSDTTFGDALGYYYEQKFYPLNKGTNGPTTISGMIAAPNGSDSMLYVSGASTDTGAFWIYTCVTTNCNPTVLLNGYMGTYSVVQDPNATLVYLLTYQGDIVGCIQDWFYSLFICL
jgi:hypothetical protein